MPRKKKKTETRMSKDRILIIDGDNMAHRALHKFGNFTTKKGYPSGVVFGVPYMISSLIAKFFPHQIYVVFDAGKAAWRKELLPNYKVRERKIDVDYEAFYQQKQDVAIALSHLGVRVIQEEGEEADDIIAVLARRLKGYLTIVSSDKDFNQLLKDNIKIWRPSTSTLLTAANLYDHVKYEPNQCVDYLALDGDKSDKIPGVRGLGEKRITKFLEQYGSINTFLDSGDKKFGSISREQIESVYNLNYKLISLGYAYRKHWRRRPTPPHTHNPFYAPLALKIFRKYEVNLLSRDNFAKNFKTLN